MLIWVVWFIYDFKLAFLADAEASKVCGCFHCEAIYPADIIDEELDYCLDVPDMTACCHFCGIDSVICDAMDVEVTKRLLSAMRKRYFA